MTLFSSQLQMHTQSSIPSLSLFLPTPLFITITTTAPHVLVIAARAQVNRLISSRQPLPLPVPLLRARSARAASSTAPASTRTRR